MSRAALMPMSGDPFILNNFLSNFDAVWKDEVDKLYILINFDHEMPVDVKEYVYKRLDGLDKVYPLFIDHRLGQGDALNYILPHVTEDIIFSIEDDTVVVKRGQVDKCFRKIETGEADVVGSPRVSCSQIILDKSAEKYNLDYSGYGDKGPNYWPNFFFCKRSDLLKTDRVFDAVTWNIGDEIKELDIVAEETITGDVFVWLSIQLRAMGLRFFDVPQYHAHPEDIKEVYNLNGVNDPNCPWIHIGSLSNTIEDILVGRRKILTPDQYNLNTMEIEEQARRIAWLKLFLSEKDNCTEELSPIKSRYEKKINELISGQGLPVTLIEKYFKHYRRFIQW